MDPALLHRYHPKSCDPRLPSKQLNMCINSLAEGYGASSQLAKKLLMPWDCVSCLNWSLVKRSLRKLAIELKRLMQNNSEMCKGFDCNSLVSVPRQLHRCKAQFTQSTLQHVHANYGTHCGQWECLHSLQATSKGLHTNLRANVLTHPVWTDPKRECREHSPLSTTSCLCWVQAVEISPLCSARLRN